MNPEEINYSECAPERDEADEAYILDMEQEVLKLDAFCTCDEDRQCNACAPRPARKMPVPAPAYTPRYAFGRRRA